MLYAKKCVTKFTTDISLPSTPALAHTAWNMDSLLHRGRTHKIYLWGRSHGGNTLLILSFLGHIHLTISIFFFINLRFY
jgi:hypothetical protein